MKQVSKFVNLVVLIDGTGNDASAQQKELHTNVARMWSVCRNVTGDSETEQRVFYRRGVGTAKGEKLSGGVAGRYLRDRVNESRSWLESEVSIAAEEGKVPRIFLFGFSRGAYAVRVLADWLNCDVWFMGVWDTVKACEGPDIARTRNNVRHIYHAMAIDEHRRLFDVQRFESSKDAVEVWFPGCHADVGGGYAENNLSIHPLIWIASMAQEYGLLIDWTNMPERPKFEGMPRIHDETKRFKWKVANAVLGPLGDCDYEREIERGDLIYPTVRELARFGYAPRLPEGCVIL